MIAWLNAFPTNVMSVVGWQVMRTGADDAQTAAKAEADINVMISQYQKVPSHCDVVAHGIQGGVPVGYFLVAAEPGVLFESASGEMMTLDMILASLAVEDTLTFMAVPPGSGHRIGIDQDSDCVGDSVDPLPATSNTGDGNFDGVVGFDDYFILATCFALDGPLPPECRAFDADCGGLLDLDDVDVFLALYEGDLADCNANGIADFRDILAGDEPDADGNGVPDSCMGALIPTVSEWGLGAMILLLITAGTLAFGRGRRVA